MPFFSIIPMRNKQILDFLHFNQPTKEQETVLKAMQEFVKADDPSDFLILCGAAGTGKTSITAALINYLNHIEINYKIAAPTGRAARILGRKSKTTTSTIHSMIYVPKSDSNTGKVSFKLKIGGNPKPMIYIINEASMIPTEVDKGESLFQAEKGLLFDLVHHIKKANVQNKIIFLGDQYQLPPINEVHSYALQKEFLEKTFNFIGSSYLLSEVKRQADGSYILTNATSIRKAIDEGEILHPIEGRKSKNIYTATDNYVKEINSKGLENSVAIGVSHKTNKFFNDLVREKVFGKAKKMIEPGDLLM